MKTYALLALFAVGLPGCWFDFCQDKLGGDCTLGAGGSSSSSTSSTTTSTNTTASNSSTSAVTAECDPLKLAAGASIDATCGVFVEPGKVGGMGTRTAPFGTVAEALAGNAMNLPIYVCATGATLDEAVTLAAAERLIGGVTCGDWTATTTKTPWTAPPNATPLRLSQTTGAVVQSFAITAANATGATATRQGNSSVAVLADEATATLQSVDVVAGEGAPGGEGADQTGQAPGRQSMMGSFDGTMGGTCNQPGAPKKVFSTCPAGGGMTEGGKGGDGDVAAGNGGGPGTPALGGGGAGAPDTGAGGWDCNANGGNGGFGTSGPAGTPTPAAGGPSTFSATAGYEGAAGGDGPPGAIGQGGGGGGGRRKGACSTTGASGGSGGAGGCGGLGGAGGGAGGASIALVSLNASLTLTDVTLTSSGGGGGGAGGDGQQGGQGGAGAFGGSGGGFSACSGGQGGNGGDGAGGGGGRGGPSIGLLTVGLAPGPAIDDASITVAASASMGGMPGGGNVPGNAGNAGDLAKKMAF